MNTWTLGSLLALMGCSGLGNPSGAATEKKVCLVLADGYVSEYAWGKYQELQFPLDHPGHNYFVRGLTGHAHRFARWLEGWQVERLDLEKHQGPLKLEGVDLVILDEVRQSVCDPYETALIEFVRAGGGLLVYAGFWGLGGAPPGEYSVSEAVSSYQHSPLGAVLPLEIQATPDLEMLSGKPPAARRPVFRDKALGAGLEEEEWEVWGFHVGQPRGEVLAELDGQPLICWGPWGRGRIGVYTGDDLAWIRAGAGGPRQRFAGTLWRRLARLAVKESAPVPAVADRPLTWEKGAAFAHPDQPINFLWGGYFYFHTPEMERLWARDLVAHSATLFSGAPEALGKAGIQGWESVGCPLLSPEAVKDPATWMRDAQGQPLEGQPCFNNPQALQSMEESVARWAADLRQRPWVTYGHMGDETEFANCYCDFCRQAFRQETGDELPPLKNDFSPAYLDSWIDYQLFKNRSIGKMYARAVQAAHARNPALRMFASLPQSGGMCHGDDQFHTQSGFDLLWDHTYPGTMAIRVGLNASLLEETAVLQGRPSVPILDLLQAFDSYDRAPHIPPPEYIREMAWQAIAHGVDSIGWFVYHAFFWNLPGSEAWEEAGRLGEEVLAPLTPTLYEMRNALQPVGLLYCYSQEAVDGLKEQVWAPDHPWKSVIRWWSLHATQEAYEVLKYAHVPFNVVSEHRLWQGAELPWKVLILPYVEHLHVESRKALQAFMAKGGRVYVGANSPLDLPGTPGKATADQGGSPYRRLPVSFDTKFTTWWPADRKEEWNQRRVRAYLISAFLEKARQMRGLLSPFCDQALVTVDDPEVVYNVRQAGVAQYLFFINDHQINPVSPEMRRKRQRYNHFMLMPMEFPRAKTSVGIRGPGVLYPLLSSGGGPWQLKPNQRLRIDLELEGGEGKVFLRLPEAITAVEFLSPPVRRADGIALQAGVRGRSGVLRASLPVRIDMDGGEVRQTVYATTQGGILAWTAPFLKEFPAGPILVTITDLASGKQAHYRLGARQGNP